MKTLYELLGSESPTWGALSLLYDHEGILCHDVSPNQIGITQPAHVLVIDLRQYDISGAIHKCQKAKFWICQYCYVLCTFPNFFDNINYT